MRTANAAKLHIVYLEAGVSILAVFTLEREDWTHVG